MRSALPLLRLEAGLRWTARALALLHLGLVLIMVVGLAVAGRFHPLRVSGVGPVQMMFFWAACVGMAAAWRWEVIGGAISLGGVLLFFAAELAVKGGLPQGPLLYLMVLPGILFLLSSLVSKRVPARMHVSLGPGGRPCPARSMGVPAAGSTRADTRPARRRGPGGGPIEAGIRPSPPCPRGGPRRTRWAEGER